MMTMVRLHLRYGVLMDLVRRSWSKIPPIELHRMERETISVAPQTAMNELGSSKWSKSKFKKNLLVSRIWSRRFLWYLHWCLLHKPPKLPIYKAAWSVDHYCYWDSGWGDMIKVYLCIVKKKIYTCIHTLQGTNPYFALGKGKSLTQKCWLGGNMLVPRRASTRIGVKIDHQCVPFMLQSQDWLWSLQIMTSTASIKTNHEWNQPGPLGIISNDWPMLRSCCEPVKVQIEIMYKKWLPLTTFPPCSKNKKTPYLFWNLAIHPRGALESNWSHWPTENLRDTRDPETNRF